MVWTPGQPWTQVPPQGAWHWLDMIKYTIGHCVFFMDFNISACFFCNFKQLLCPHPVNLRILLLVFPGIAASDQWIDVFDHNIINESPTSYLSLKYHNHEKKDYFTVPAPDTGRILMEPESKKYAHWEKFIHLVWWMYLYRFADAALRAACTPQCDTVDLPHQFLWFEMFNVRHPRPPRF